MSRYALIVAVIIANCLSAVRGQCGSPGVTKRIASQADLTDIASCVVFIGNIDLANSLSGNITLGGVELIKGDLTCNGAIDLVSFEVHDLESVEGDYASATIERTGLDNKTVYLHRDYPTKKIVFRDNPNLWMLTINGYDTEVEEEIAVTGSPRAELDIWGLEDIGGLELRNIRKFYASTGAITNVTGDVIIENVNVGYSMENLEAVGGDLKLYNTSANHNEYGHVNVIELSSLCDVGGKLEVYNIEEHTSVFVNSFDSYCSQPDIGSVDIAGLIHELPDSIDFGTYGINTSYINFRSSNSFFDCCRYAYLTKRLRDDFWCAENVTLSDGDYESWEINDERPTGVGVMVNVTKCKASEDSPKYSNEPSSSSSGGGSNSGGGSSSYSGEGVNLSSKSKKLIGGIVGPVVAMVLLLIGYCFRRNRKQKKKEAQESAEPDAPAQMAQAGASAVIGIDSKNPQTSVMETPNTYRSTA